MPFGSRVPGSVAASTGWICMKAIEVTKDVANTNAVTTNFIVVDVAAGVVFKLSSCLSVVYITFTFLEIYRLILC